MTTQPTTATTQPCLRCHNPGGYRKPNRDTPHRARGLCAACYEVVYRAGKLDDYPRTNHISGASCLGCRERFGWACRHNGRGLCQACYERAITQGVVRDYPSCGPRPVPYSPGFATHPAIPVGIVTPAMLGIAPDQPATDRGLTPAKVREIGTTNAERAARWLQRRGNYDVTLWGALVWQPATLPTVACRAA